MTVGEELKNEIYRVTKLWLAYRDSPHFHIKAGHMNGDIENAKLQLSIGNDLQKQKALDLLKAHK